MNLSSGFSLLVAAFVIVELTACKADAYGKGESLPAEEITLEPGQKVERTISYEGSNAVKVASNMTSTTAGAKLRIEHDDASTGASPAPALVLAAGESKTCDAAWIYGSDATGAWEHRNAEGQRTGFTIDLTGRPTGAPPTTGDFLTMTACGQRQGATTIRLTNEGTGRIVLRWNAFVEIHESDPIDEDSLFLRASVSP